ncbi:hypothetical protein [Candidatus Stoquefichus massiliensis]|uniref:hypothetical protein n=1 Tax=Candidatus Stoquefichus massiliensis TaxID=1470350 RepID=UPI0004898874|nr:hypothetical protein [Candidatus Stoquefichus massiliensis]
MELYERIANIKAELRYIKSHKDYLETLKKECSELELRKSDYEKRLYKENKDVDNLEKTTILSLFHSIIGNKEERLEKERQEAMEVSLQYHHICNEYQLKKDEIKKLQKRIQQEYTLQQQLEEVQLEFIKQTNPQQGVNLQELLRQYEDLQKISKEINEAIEAGVLLKDILNNVLSELSSAKGWGVYDMLGGGMISTAIKHHHMDNAQKDYETVKIRLAQFEKELKDVQDLSIEYNHVGPTLMTFDYIFDSLFVDWLVQSKISKNKRNIQELNDQVDQVMNELNQKIGDIEDKRKEKYRSIQNILGNI